MSESTWFFDLQSMERHIALRMLVAAVLGALIGVEREWNGRDAGLRTNMLVAIGSCLFTILSIEAFPTRGANQDSARIAAQIVSGIGFLGAGALFRDSDRVRGVTTAATVWFVAAIGMAIGSGMIFLGVFSTVLALLVLAGLAPLSSWISSRTEAKRAPLDTPPNGHDPTPAQPHDIVRQTVSAQPGNQERDS